MKPPLSPRGTQKEMMADPKWNGVPPVGDRPIENKWKFLGLVLLVFIVKIVIWGTYRFITGNVYPFTDPEIGRELTYWVGAFAKPILQLGPIVILWWYIFKERGNPFKFTRKNLASSIFFGLLMALAFFFVATGVYVVHNLIMGYGTDFHFVAGWDEVGWGLVIATMISYMIGTGPAEELFSRGFLQDQTARVFPLWQAMAFSAVLFAIGHLPISILMYHMPIVEIMWYMAILVVMGMFFSIIYQWSRNIVFPILIHGLWDWYLTLFAIKGEFSAEFASNPGAFFGMVDFINTLITLVILMPVFYLIYRKFWRKNIISTGSPDDTPRERNLIVAWLRDRDMGDWPKRPLLTTSVIVLIFCLLMLPFAALIGTDDPGKHADRVSGGGAEVFIVTEQFRDLYGQELSDRETASFDIMADNGTINWIEVNLTWEDEPDQGIGGVRYTNQPDTFRISLFGNEIELDSEEGSNGFLSVVWKIQEGEEAFDQANVEVELTRTGDQVPLFSIIGLRNIADNSNTFAVDIKFEITHEVEGEEKEINVRW